MVNSGMKFFNRYRELTQILTPFVRSSSEPRVVESAQNFTQGFHAAKVSGGGFDSGRGGWWSSWWSQRDPSYPYDIVVISEADGSNNTLNHGLCTAFENGSDSTIAGAAQATWAAIFATPIQARLNGALAGANLTLSDTINMLDMCPFNTVASPDGVVSPFCNLFTPAEWSSYDHYESLGKYYGYGAGNPLGPTQGVGFVNELIARLKGQPVQDNPATSINRTLDADASTFPVGGTARLFADFSHDNDMTAIFAAMGLYNATEPLSKTLSASARQEQGYLAAWTVPFAGRAYVEKMRCAGEQEEMVRILVNDRVVPLEGCGADAWGRCGLDAFVESLRFARGGGLWGQCFA